MGLLLPLTLLIIALAKSSRAWRKFLAGRPWWHKAGIVALFAVAALVGGEKPGPVVPPEIIEILTRRADGSLTDLSGQIASGVQAQAVQDYLSASAMLVTAADGVVSNAAVQCVTLTNQLLQADYDIAYVTLDLPRGTPAETNHNILVSFQRVEQSLTNLDALVWFSEMPSTNVNIFVEYSIAEGVWGTLPPVTNFWPATETVDGVECVRYRYEIPSGISGTPLKPQYEVAFGGDQADQYLSVPETGVVVSTNGVDCLPFTGWDNYSSGTNSLLVRYVGGIAVEAVQDGVSITGVNQL
jgi:hypothetical protein